MRNKFFVLIALLILLVLVAIRRPSDSSTRFTNMQKSLAKPHAASTTR